MEQVQAKTEQFGFDYERRKLNDTRTLVAEMLDGNMRTPFEFTFDGQELYADDGGELGPVFDKSIRQAERLGPNLKFEVRRTLLEKGEYDDMIGMMKGELPNTMVVVSDFPAELMNAKKDVGGYNVTRKQTMLRVITKTSEGRLLMRSQSLDGSDRKALETLYTTLGVTAEPGELLGQRMHLDLTVVNQEFLLDRLMGVYDRKLTASYGGDWYAGRRNARRINTYSFVCEQNDLVFAYLSREYGADPYSDSFYDLAAALDARLNKLGVRSAAVSLPVYQPGILHNPYIEMRIAGSNARKDGKGYSGCGISIGNKKSALDQLKELGLGTMVDEFDTDDEDEEETPYDFDTLMFCNEHQAPPKEDEDEVWCGPCGFCEPCDKEIRRRNKAKYA
ncbi:hypothetical protein BH10PAT3_BH10PAT3_6090 [soil metagenome]